MLNKIKKTVIITGYRCNNKCQFCLDEDKRDLHNKSTVEIKKEMVGAKERGTTYLELIGGEALIRPDIITLIKFASQLGFSTINIATNGRMLAYKNFAKKVIKAGLTDFVFSIHGHNSKLHDSLTRVEGSFKQLRRGFRNAKNLLGLEHMGTNTTIVKQNYKNLKEIGEMIYGLGIRNSEFIFVDPSCGAAYNNFEKYVPRISKATPYIKECLEIGRRRRVRHWSIRYVPLCYFKDRLDQVSELKEVEVFHSEHLAPDFQNFDVENSRRKVGRIKTRRCSGCKLHSKCEGIWKEYIKQYSDRELSPVKRKI